MKKIKPILQLHVLSRAVHDLHRLPHFPGLPILDAVASDALAPQTHGDGVIRVTEIAQCIHIRTGEAQDEAL